MKILFIKPPNFGLYHEIERYYPVGIAYLAAALCEAGHKVKIFDCLVYTEENYVMEYETLPGGQKEKVDNHPSWRNVIYWGARKERIMESVEEFMPDIVSITSMHTPMYDSAYMVVDMIKAIYPNIIIFMGGPHPSIAYEHVLKNARVDYVLLGEGENSIVELVNCIENKIEPYDVDGIVFIPQKKNLRCNRELPNGTKYYLKEKAEWICNLDELPFPAAHLLEIEKYERISIITSRGCPFTCSFCTVHPTVGYKYRARSPENVVKEIEWYINNFNVHKFNIEDDNFTFDYDRANKILDLIISKNLSVSINFPNGITALFLDENFVKKLVKVGIKGSFIGLETTSSERLKKLTKTFTSLERVKQIITWFRKNNSKIGASLIVGFPDQTLEEMIEDIVRLMENKVEFGTANPCYPIPMSQLYDECIDKGFISNNLDYTWFDEFNFPLQTNNYTREDIYNLWLCSLVYDYYPKICNYELKKTIQIEKAIEMFRGFGYGDVIEEKEGFYCIPRTEDVFSHKMRLLCKSCHYELFVDKLTSDILSTLFSLLTNVYYDSIQCDTSLRPNSQSIFWIEAKNQGKNIKIVQMFRCAIIGS